MTSKKIKEMQSAVSDFKLLPDNNLQVSGKTLEGLRKLGREYHALMDAEEMHIEAHARILEQLEDYKEAFWDQVAKMYGLKEVTSQFSFDSETGIVTRQ